MHDLSHPIETGMPTYPGDPAVTVEPAATHVADGYRVERVELGSHTGTHVDAPAHTEPDGRTLDTYDPAAFVLDAARIDCRDLDDREPLPPERIPDDPTIDCVVLWTDWDTHWGTDRYLDHPYLSPAAAQACVDRGYAVATDTLNPDPTPTENATADEPDGLPAHHALLGADLLVYENLTGLDAVTDRFTLHALPLALSGDGAPVRAVAISD
jgi:kynurenine formamidase